MNSVARNLWNSLLLLVIWLLDLPIGKILQIVKFESWMEVGAGKVRWVTGSSRPSRQSAD